MKRTAYIVMLTDEERKELQEHASELALSFKLVPASPKYPHLETAMEQLDRGLKTPETFVTGETN